MKDAETKLVSLIQEQISSKINDEILKNFEPTFIPWFDVNFTTIPYYNHLLKENILLKELINEYYNYT